MPAWLGALIGIGALLLAAKAHGRQVRFEREAAGYRSVVFGGENPEFVTQLWRRDRIRFWTTAPIASAILGAAAWWAQGWPLALAAALLGGPVVAFHVAGLASFTVQRGRGGTGWWAASMLAAAFAVVATLV
jgi:hypothetical protein